MSSKNLLPRLTFATFLEVPGASVSLTEEKILSCEVFLFEKVLLEVGVEVSSVVSEPHQVLPTPTKTFLEEVPQLHLRLEPQG